MENIIEITHEIKGIDTLKEKVEKLVKLLNEASGLLKEMNEIKITLSMTEKSALSTLQEHH